MRWRSRAKELGVSEPDASILLRGLGRIIRKPLEAHRELNFRINLTRSMLQVDSTPDANNVHQFATHLLAEMELIAHAEGGRKIQPKEALKPAEVRMKRFEKEGEEKTWKKDQREQPCRFFNTDAGCRKGKECKWLHQVEEGKRRCWTCGAVDHFSQACPRAKEKGADNKKGGGKGEAKGVQRMEAESPPRTGGGEIPQKDGEVGSQSEESGEVMKGLLEEANRTLKNISDNKSEKGEEGDDREGKLRRLQRQLDDLKALRVFRIASIGESGGHGLLDSGATHALRGRKPGEKLSQLPEVRVHLACGRETLLRMTTGGTMAAASENVEPIVPLGRLVRKIGCKVGWNDDGLVLVHPRRGKLKVYEKEGCPHVEGPVALELIEELDQAEMVKLKEVKIPKTEAMEAKWIEDLVEAHPVLRTLPSEVKKALKVNPAMDLRGLPQVNRRRRKRIMREGALIHLYAGEKEGYTLSRAMKEIGADRSTLVEIDLCRGEGHDMMMDQPYASMLRLTLDGKLRSVVGGPNCRTRSVLRHYPLEDVEGGGRRPLRTWGKGEFGKEDLTRAESHMVWEDDVLLWRMVMLYIIAEEVNKLDEEKKKKIGFGIEQPAYPEYMLEVVSLWRTSQWGSLKRMYDLKEITFNQGDLKAYA